MCSGISSLGRATRPSGNSGKSRTSSTVIQSRRRPVPRTMATTALVWFRRDLRVHDHPPLRAALDACERVVPVFVLDDRLLRRPLRERQPHAVPARLPEGAARRRCRSAAANLVVVRGDARAELPKLAREHDATAVYFASDVSPFAMARDKRVEAALQARRASSRAARPATSSPTSASSSRTRSSRRSGGRGRSCRGARSTARRARSRSPSDLTVGEHPEPRARADGPGPLPGGETRRAASGCSPGDARTTYDDARRPASTASTSHALARTCTSAASQRPRARGARGAATPTPASSPGATSTPTCSCTTPTTPSTPTGASSTRSSGTATTSTSTPGARAARAIPSSTPACASSRRPAGCTTAPA